MRGLGAKPILEDRAGVVLLRPFTASDIEAMGPILADPEVGLLTGSVADRAAALDASPVLDARTREWYATRADQRDRLDLAVIDPSSDTCVGEVVLNEVREHDRCANVRMLLGPAGRGRGLGTAALRLFVDHVFTATDLHRLELEVFAHNPRARRVYDKVGFVAEGVRRQALRQDDVWIDSILMSMLRPEWETRSDRPLAPPPDR